MRSIKVPVALLLSAMPAALSAQVPSERRFAADASESPRFNQRMPVTPDTSVPSRRSGPFIASLPIAPNASIGFGKFNMPAQRKLSLQDQPVSLEARKFRRAAVGVALRF